MAKKLGSGPTPRARASGKGFECAGPYEAAHAPELPSKAQAGPRNPTKVLKI